MIFRRKKVDEDRLLRESHLKNLMVLAMADGHLAEIEKHLLEAIAHRLNLTHQDIESIRKDIDSVKFILPDKYDDRIEQFNDLLSLMAADGHIDPEEEVVCKNIAKKYELMDSVYDELISKYL